MKFGVIATLFLLLILGTLGGSWFFVFKAGSERQTTLRKSIEAKQKALADLQQSTRGVDDLGNKIADLQKAIDFFESKLPQEKEIDKILKEVWQMAEANSLTTKTIKTLKSERSAHYSEQPIQLSLSGDFTGFYAFLLQLEKLPRITRLTQMNLQKIPEHDGQMQATLTLSIYFEPDAAQRVAGAN